MKITDLEVAGAHLITLDKFVDDRGSFSRIYCEKELVERGICENIVQINLSQNSKKGTVRGIHYQTNDFQETKIIRCIRGSIFDILVDLRPESSTYGKWLGYELSEKNQHALVVPKGCGHAFQTLEDNSDIIYFVDNFYTPNSEGGVFWKDPELNVQWPHTDNVTISDKDADLPTFREYKALQK